MPTNSRPAHSGRSKARKRALDIVFEADQRQVPVAGIVSQRRERGATVEDPPYATELAEGVVLHSQRIDELLTQYSNDWPLDRMPAVDRAALRLGVYELLWQGDVPAAVVINEWVELVKQLSTDESPAFVNGVLGSIEQHRPASLLERPTSAPDVVPPVGFEPTNPAV